MFSYFVLWLCNFLIPFINYIQFCSTSLFWRYIKASEGKSICTMFLTEITWMFLTDKINWTVGFIHNWKLGKLPNLWSEEILRRYSNILQFELLWIGPHHFAGLNHLTHCNYVIDSIPSGILNEQIFLPLEIPRWLIPWEPQISHLYFSFSFVWSCPETIAWFENTPFKNVCMIWGNSWQFETESVQCTAGWEEGKRYKKFSKK